ncbi:MAG: hypothetical protein AB7F43_15170 [Bacteriovoracia bacterium]
MDVIKSEDNEIIAIAAPVSPIEYWKARALKAEQRSEATELALMYAQDIVDIWPTVTLRTLWKVTDKVASLKATLKEAISK